MYLSILIWSLIATVVAAKLDKNLTKLIGGDFEKGGHYDDWHEYYNGRKTMYKIFTVISIVPFLNWLSAVIMTCLSLCLILARVIKSTFWSKRFWDKLF